MSPSINTIASRHRFFVDPGESRVVSFLSFLYAFSYSFLYILFFGTARQACGPLSNVAKGGLFLVEAKGRDPISTLFARIPEAVG